MEDITQGLQGIQQRVRELLLAVCERPAGDIPTDPALNLIEAGLLDSVAFEHLLSDLERRYGIELETHAVRPPITVERIARAVLQTLRAEPSATQELRHGV